MYDRGTIDAILDEALICHLAWVTSEGEPRVIPTIHVRVDDILYVHGSQASRTLRAIRGGATVCIETTIIDGLVLARSTPKHSMNYRSVVVFGAPREVTDREEMHVAQRALAEHVVPGRGADARAAERHGVQGDGDLRAPARRGVGEGPHRPADRSRRGSGARRLGGRDPDPHRRRGAGAGPGLSRPGIDPPAYVTDYRRPGR